MESVTVLLLLFVFWVFGSEACGTLVPQPGIKPTPSALKSKVLTTGPPGKSRGGAFTKVMKLKWGYMGVPNPTCRGSYWQEGFGHWHVQREHDLEIWGEKAAVSTPKREALTWSLSQCLWKESTVLTPPSWTFGLQNGEKVHFCCLNCCLNCSVPTSLVVQGLRIPLPMQGVQVRPLVRELRSHMPQGPKNPEHKTEGTL